MQPEVSAEPSRFRLWVSRLTFTTGGTGAELVLRFLRTFFLSHLLSPTEFGVTVALSVVIFTSELVTDIGLGPFVLNRSEDGDSSVLATAHSLQLLRGLVIAGSIALAGPYVAQFFSVPQYAASFSLVSVFPLIRAFGHLGVKQVQRSYDYRLEAISIGVSQIISLAATIVAGLILRDHRAILVGFICEALVFTVMTHRLSPMRFSMSIDPSLGREALTFGVPLIVSGVATAVANQADRMAVGYFFGVETLGVYGVILTVAMVPLGSVYRIVASVASAMLARDRERPDQFAASYSLVTWGFIVLGFAYAGGLALLLDIVTPLVFGPAYMVAASIHLLISTIAFTRILRWSATLLLLAAGATRKLAIANIVNGIGLMLGVGIVILRPALSSVLIGVLVGEIMSNFVFQRAALHLIPSARRLINQANLFSVFCGCFIVVGLAIIPEPILSKRLMLAAVFVPPAILALLGLLKSWKRREATRAIAAERAPVV
jgi:O-antigen/teichoic acid export membrane protein